MTCKLDYEYSDRALIVVFYEYSTYSCSALLCSALLYSILYGVFVRDTKEKIRESANREQTRNPMNPRKTGRQEDWRTGGFWVPSSKGLPSGQSPYRLDLFCTCTPRHPGGLQGWTFYSERERCAEHGVGPVLSCSPIFRPSLCAPEMRERGELRDARAARCLCNSQQIDPPGTHRDGCDKRGRQGRGQLKPPPPMHTTTR